MFTIKPLCPTDTKGTRTKIIDNRFGVSKTIGYNYSLNSHYENAKEYLKAKGFNPLYLAETKNGYTILCDDFKKLA